MRIAVGREHDDVGVEIVHRLDGGVLADVRTRLGREPGEAPHPAGRLDRAVRRVEDCSEEAAGERLVQLTAPLGLEAVRPQSVVFGAELRQLSLAGGEAEAARVAERVARKRLDPIERALGQRPERASAARAELSPSGIVGGCAAAQGETAVAPARAPGHPARLVHADARAAARERERTRAAGDAAADDGGVRPAGNPPRCDRRRLLHEPIRRRHAAMLIPRDHPPVQPFRLRDEAGELEPDQGGADGRRVERGRACKLVGARGPFPQAVEHSAIRGGELGGGRRRPADVEHLEHVVGSRQGSRAHPQKAVRPRRE